MPMHSAGSQPAHCIDTPESSSSAQVGHKMMFRRQIVRLLLAPSSGSLLGFFFWSLCPQLQSVNTTGSIELFLQ
jgi:hypothetical protein